MSTKTWEQLTQPEKIEDLRRDLLHTMEVVNGLSRRCDAFATSFGDVRERLNALEKKTPKKKS